MEVFLDFDHRYLRGSFWWRRVGVGIAAEAPPGAIDSGFFYDNGNFTLIRFPGATVTYANGISNNGLIVGQYSTGNGFLGFLYDHGTYTTISFPGSTSSTAVGVNSNGEIVGTYTDTLGGRNGFLFNGSSYETISPPIGINDLGQILVSAISPCALGIVNGGSFTPISLPSSAYCVTGFNDLDQLVGTFTETFGHHGFVDDHGVINIFQVPESVTPDGTSTLATGINDFGETTGSWQGSQAGHEHAYVATPVPEPATLSLAAIAVVTFAALFAAGRCIHFSA
ncbi:MAG TPA: hypothetical protein VF214_02565 [Edaphobacter sp.]